MGKKREHYEKIAVQTVMYGLQSKGMRVWERNEIYLMCAVTMMDRLKNEVVRL